MRPIYLTLLASLLAGCLSAPREREAHCLAATMADMWQAEEQLSAVEEAWRKVQSVSTQRAAVAAFPPRTADTNGLPLVAVQARLGRGDFSHFSFRTEEERSLYGSLVSARAHRADASKWLRLVALRVQTRIEEDDMLYPVLGILATSTAIVLYPLVRWNVRSVLWDGADPDANDDPVQRFCAERLGQAAAILL